MERSFILDSIAASVWSFVSPVFCRSRFLKPWLYWHASYLHQIGRPISASEAATCGLLFVNSRTNQIRRYEKRQCKSQHTNTTHTLHLGKIQDPLWKGLCNWNNFVFGILVFDQRMAAGRAEFFVGFASVYSIICSMIQHDSSSSYCGRVRICALSMNGRQVQSQLFD